MRLEPGPANACFGCGGANPRGMKLTFEQDDAARRIRGAFRVGAEYQGGPGFVHGGIIATLLDEVMGKVNRFRNVRAVTAELQVEYLRPVPVDEGSGGRRLGSREEGPQSVSRGRDSQTLPARCWRAARDASSRSTPTDITAIARRASEHNLSRIQLEKAAP